MGAVVASGTLEPLEELTQLQFVDISETQFEGKSDVTSSIESLQQSQHQTPILLFFCGARDPVPGKEAFQAARKFASMQSKGPGCLVKI